MVKHVTSNKNERSRQTSQQKAEEKKFLTASFVKHLKKYLELPYFIVKPVVNQYTKQYCHAYTESTRL